MLYIILIALSILYLILFNIKTPIQYYVKYFTFVFLTMTFALLIIPICSFRPNNLKNAVFIANALNILYKIFKVKIEIVNEENLNVNKSYILLANHQSSIDYMMMMKLWPILPHNCTPLAKKELIYAGPFGLACWLCGVTFIDRLNRDKAKGTIDMLSTKINRDNLIIWIFPEGTRNPNTELKTFKKGAFHLAVQAKVPIVPIVISSYSDFYDKNSKLFSSGTVRIKVLEPIETKQLTSEDVNELTLQTHDKMQEAYDQLNKSLNKQHKLLLNDSNTDLDYEITSDNNNNSTTIKKDD